MTAGDRVRVTAGVMDGEAGTVMLVRKLDPTEVELVNALAVIDSAAAIDASTEMVAVALDNGSPWGGTIDEVETLVPEEVTA